MNRYGLIGYPLCHSFSKKYFTEKFEKEGIPDSVYELFEMEKVGGLKDFVLHNPEILGLNVTIPHKEHVLPLMDSLDDSAKKCQAVNVIKVFPGGMMMGYNSDYYGFKMSLETWMGSAIKGTKALILGTGGASKAVQTALNDLGIESTFVSRKPDEGELTYAALTPEVIAAHTLIVNTTPLGMYPKTDACPEIPYHLLTAQHYLYDLVYNPEETLFMKKGIERGARAKNGLEMLHLQAEKAWEIWNT